MKTPDYLSYTSYKKKKKNNSKKSITIFLTTFFATLLVFTFIAKQLTPDVDVTIGEETDMEAKETGLGVKRFIDNRLKMIQMEDNSAGVAKRESDKSAALSEEEDFDSFAEDLDERVYLPKKKPAKEDTVQKAAKETITPPRPKPTDEINPFDAPKMSKVFVGYYSSIEHAKVAQGILMDADLGVTPFIKNIGGAFTLQVGSYSSKAKAAELANELLRNNFPARVVQE